MSIKTIYDYICDPVGFWGSIASIIGLLIVVWHFRRRINGLEQRINLDAESESVARATAEAKGGNHTVTQTQVGGAGHRGAHKMTCRHLPSGEQDVDVTIDPSTGETTHVACTRLQPNYFCDAPPNQGKNCIVIHPDSIRVYRMRKSPNWGRC